ncbi:MAG: hypothetical protein WCQ50_18190 [Spirochaetota bacterium]
MPSAILLLMVIPIGATGFDSIPSGQRVDFSASDSVSADGVWHGDSGVQSVFDAGVRVGLVLERGPFSTRLAPCLGLTASTKLPFAGGCFDVDTTVSIGAFVGQVLSLEASGMYKPFPSGAWRPRVGVGFLLDAGDYFFSATKAAIPPPIPQAYVVLRIDPLRIYTGDAVMSWLGCSAGMGLWGYGTIYRFEAMLFQLSYRW